MNIKSIGMEQTNLIDSGSKPTGAKRPHESDDEMEERKIKIQKAEGWNESQEAKFAGLRGANTAEQQLSLNQPTGGTDPTAFQGGSSTDDALWNMGTTKSTTKDNAHSAGDPAFIRSQSAPL